MAPFGSGSEVLCAPGVGVDFPDEGNHKLVGLQVLSFDGSLPLGKKGYSAEPDTLVCRNRSSATVVVDEDLVAHFGPTPCDPGYLCLLAV